MKNFGRAGRAEAFRRVLAMALLAALTLTPGRARGGGGADPATLESQVKSAFVLNFVQFVDWPDGTFNNAEAPIVIGVVSAEQIGTALAAASEGKTIKGRKVMVKTFAPGAVGACHVLVAGAGTDGPAIIRAVSGAPALTVGDGEGFTNEGGMIRFYLEDRKVRFEINLAAAQRARLQISAKLLKLAKVVNK